MIGEDLEVVEKLSPQQLVGRYSLEDIEGEIKATEDYLGDFGDDQRAWKFLDKLRRAETLALGGSR